MKHKLLLLSALTLLIVASCKKILRSPDEAKTCTMTEIGATLSGVTMKVNYSYDENGKVTKGTWNDGNEETYFHMNNKVILISKSGSTTNYTIEYVLNNGRAVSAVEDNAYNIVYSYNADGYLTQEERTEIATNKKSLVKYTYSNENLKEIDGYGDKVTFTYNSDLANSNFYYEFVDYSPYKPLRSYLGKQSKNRVTKIQVVSGSVTRASGFAYTNDSNGNIANIVEKTAGSEVIFNAVYNCK